MFPFRNLNQDITCWRLLGPDGMGGFLFDAPYIVKGRWEDRAEIFRDPQGDEVVSNAICYLREQLNEGDYLAEGDYTDTTDPSEVQRANRVVQQNRMTDLRAMTMHYKVYM